MNLVMKSVPNSSLRHHNLDPHSLPDISSSSFVYVINAAAYIPYYWVGKITGVFKSPQDIPAPTMLDMGVGQASKPSTFLLGRIVSVLFGTAGVILILLIGRQLFKSSLIGIIAAAMMAISPTNVSISRFITPDTFVVFFVLLAFLGTVRLYQFNKRADAILTGVALGCLMSSKISGMIIVIPLLLVFFLRRGVKAIFEPNLYVILVTGIVAFVVTTPYVFGDFQFVIRDLITEGRHYATGHAGMEGNTLVWYLKFMWGTTLVICLVAGIEIIRGIYLQLKEIILLSIFPVIYFIFISSFIVRNDRTFLPMTPFIFLLAASFLVFLLKKALSLSTKYPRIFGTIAVLCLLAVCIFLPGIMTIKNNVQITTIDSRETSRLWINHNLPEGAKIGIEAYSPFIDPGRFSVISNGSMAIHDPAWYINQQFDYLVFSQGMYARFFADPERYGEQILAYDNLFNRFQLVKFFEDGGL